MAIRRVFKSLASDQRAYAFDTEYFNYRTQAYLSDHFRVFETYGHGLIAHSPGGGRRAGFRQHESLVQR